MNHGHMDMDDDACYRAIETRDGWRWRHWQRVSSPTR
jgi:hypothetical protein